jgi:uncharacterized protein (DUF927 family)
MIIKQCITDKAADSILQKLEENCSNNNAYFKSLVKYMKAGILSGYKSMA